MAEYLFLLRRFGDAQVISSMAVVSSLPQAPPNDEVEDGFRNNYPDIAHKLVIDASEGWRASSHTLANSDLLYTVFLNNALKLLGQAEEHSVPFVFTLYPGGGFQMSSESAKKLSEVTSHPMFAGMIITQPATLKFVKRRFPRLLRDGKVAFVWGGVLSDHETDSGSQHQARGGVDVEESPVRVCFIGNKYDPLGLDKGFDLFLEAVRHFAGSDAVEKSIEFHSVGPWTSDDFGDCAQFITNHGLIENKDLGTFLDQMHIGLFPTRAHRLGPGSLDGFPVGAAVECGKRGVAVVTTNPLRQSGPLQRGKDFLEIKPQKSSVIRALTRLIEEPVTLAAFQRQAKVKFNEIYSIDAQMMPRVDFLSRSLSRFLGECRRSPR